MGNTKTYRRNRIRQRIKKVISGTSDFPRLSVFRSNKEIYCQLIDDINGKTLIQSSSRDKSIIDLKLSTNMEVSFNVGKVIAEKAIKEAEIEQDGSIFTLRTGVNKNPTKLGLKIQFEPLGDGLESDVKSKLEVALQEKLNVSLQQYDIQVSKDTDVPRPEVIGFFIPLAQLKNLIVKSLTGQKVDAPDVKAPEPEGEELNEQLLREMRIRDLNEISKVVKKDDFYEFINKGNNILRDLEDAGMPNGKKYLMYLVKHNIM